ncbi:MAG: hypothetical protein AAF533_09840 [Acidobacteriota bacterium]
MKEDLTPRLRRLGARLKARATPCPEPEELAEHAVGMLDPTRVATVREHLSGCNDCLRELVAIETAEGSNLTLVKLASTAVRLRRLVSFEIPTYQPLGAVRDADETPDPADDFAVGMAHYSAGEHASAVPALEKAAAQRGAPAQVALYLGVSYLAEERAEEAVTALQKAKKKSPRAPVIPWLLAQAQLSAGDGLAAEKTLTSIAKGAGPHAAEAATQLAELKEVLASD